MHVAGQGHALEVGGQRLRFEGEVRLVGGLIGGQGEQVVGQLPGAQGVGIDVGVVVGHEAVNAVGALVHWQGAGDQALKHLCPQWVGSGRSSRVEEITTYKLVEKN